MILTNQSNNKYKNNNERELHRYEFVEFIVRMSKSVYCDSKRETTIIGAIEAIFSQHILPNNPAIDGLSFRKEHMYKLRVDFLLKNNLVPIQKLFNQIKTPKKCYITLEACKKLMKGAGV